MLPFFAIGLKNNIDPVLPFCEFKILVTFSCQARLNGWREKKPVKVKEEVGFAKAR
jgi:hypothetical protein